MFQPDMRLMFPIYWFLIKKPYNSGKLKRRGGKALNSPQAKKKMTFHINMLLECIVVQKYIYDSASASASS